MVREIMVAARSGGPSPEANPGLRSAMERAKSLGLPKDNIERALARALGGGEGLMLQEFLYEAVAPLGVALLIEGITDNKQRTLAEIKKILGEYGGRLAEPGSLLWNFEKVGTLEIGGGQDQGKTSEEIELAAIESGARDFKKIENVWLVETDFRDLERVRKSLLGAGMKIGESGHDYKPKNALLLSEKDYGTVTPLLNSLADHADVQEVYTNIQEA